MITLDLFQFIAVAFAMCGLAVVIWEIAVKDPRSFREIASDVRRFAERPVAPSTERAETAVSAPERAGSGAADVVDGNGLRSILPR